MRGIGISILSVVLTMVTMAQDSAISFKIALDHASYSAGAPLTARLTLSSSQPIEVTHPSAQTADLVIYDSQGKVVARWSQGRMFAMMMQKATYGPGEKTFDVTMKVPAVPSGDYVAEGMLASSPEKQFVARVPFRVQ